MPCPSLSVVQWDKVFVRLSLLTPLANDLICVRIIGLYKGHAYYDNTYLSSSCHMKISSGLQRRWISLPLFYIGHIFCRNCLAPENYLKDIFRLLIRRMTKRKKSRRMNNKCTPLPCWNGICSNKTWKALQN